jgi:hypothetical protein
MIVGALLANIVDAGTGVLTLAEGMDFATFQRSRLARAEIGRLVEVMATSLADLPDALRHRFAEIAGAPGPPSPTRSAKPAPPATKPCGSPSNRWCPPH